MPIRNTIRVDGIQELRKALGQFAPDIKKQLDKANREASRPLIAFGKQNMVSIPMTKWFTSGWNDNGRDLRWDKATADKGIKIKMRGKSKRSEWSSVMQFRNESAVGAIFEAAGRKNKPTTVGGEQFIKNTQRWFYVKGNGLTRGIWKAFFKDFGSGRFVDIVMKNYQEAEDALQKRLDKI
jgi:hypothetical protein